jgi:hypothetical protein
MVGDEALFPRGLHHMFLTFYGQTVPHALCASRLDFAALDRFRIPVAE